MWAWRERAEERGHVVSELGMGGCRFVKGEFSGGAWFDDHGARGIREYTVTIEGKSQQVVES